MPITDWLIRYDEFLQKTQNQSNYNKVFDINLTTFFLCMHMLRTGLKAHLAFILYFQYRLGTAQITYQFFRLVKQPNTRNSVLQNTKFAMSTIIYRRQRTKTLRKIRKEHKAVFTCRLHFRRFPAFPPTKALNRGLSRQNTAIYTKFFLNKPRPRLTVCTH